jgi:hypothetical protein
MGTIPVNLDPDATTLEAAQANVLASAKLQCDFRNNDLKTLYLTAFNNWKISVDAGRIDTSNPPQPPNAFVVKTDKDGWAYVSEGDQPVCEMPPLPEDRVTPKPAPAPMTIDIGHSADGGAGVWFTVGPNDSWPVGKTTPPMEVAGVDGVHTYLRVGTAVGKGWYERVS